MKSDNDMPLPTTEQSHPTAIGMTAIDAGSPLRECVNQALERYFAQLDGQPVTGVYDMVMAEVEVPLLLSVLKHTHHNQSRAAEVLGLNRGTLRKKLRQYDINPGDDAHDNRKSK